MGPHGLKNCLTTWRVAGRKKTHHLLGERNMCNFVFLVCCPTGPGVRPAARQNQQGFDPRLGWSGIGGNCCRPIAWVIRNCAEIETRFSPVSKIQNPVSRMLNLVSKMQNLNPMSECRIWCQKHEFVRTRPPRGRVRTSIRPNSPSGGSSSDGSCVFLCKY